MATMVMRMLILVSSYILISCNQMCTYGGDIVSLYGDSSINRFVLRDTLCFKGINNMPNIIDDPNIGEFVGFSNASSTEFLLLVRENGGYDKQFNYFYLTDSVSPEYVELFVNLPDSFFITTLGAHIGCSEKEFCDKYKKIKFNISQNATGSIYEFQDTINKYRSIYKFDNGYLSHIELGYMW